MNIDTMLSQILYCLSGFLFGIFASRYSVISWRTLASRPPLLQCAPYVLFIIAAFTLFPFWLITRTEAGGFISFSYTNLAPAAGELMGKYVGGAYIHKKMQPRDLDR